MTTKKTIRKWLIICTWFAVGGTVLGLLIAAAIKKDASLCKGIDPTIYGFNKDFFIEEKDIESSIVASIGMPVKEKSIGSFDLRKLELELEKNIWIKKANLFFDNNGILHAKIQGRLPIARIFTTAGTSFYIDTALTRLPVTELKAVNVQVFTSFPGDKIVLSAADSLLLMDVRNISMALQKDSFCMAMIDQVDITQNRKFEMVPKLGNHVILFGDASDIDKKIERLKLFYSKVFAKAGMNYYAILNVQYEGQVVAKKRGAEDVSSDSLRATQLIQLIAENAARQSGDSLEIMQQDNMNNTADSSMINQSIERDEQAGPATSEPAETLANPAVPVTNPAVVQNNNPPARQPRPVTVNPKPPPKPPPVRTNPPKPNRQQPRAVMPARGGRGR